MTVDRLTGRGRVDDHIITTITPYRPNDEYRFRAIVNFAGFVDYDFIALDHTYMDSNGKGATWKTHDNRIATIYFGGVYRKLFTPKITYTKKVLDQEGRKVLLQFRREYARGDYSIVIREMKEDEHMQLQEVQEGTERAEA